MKLNLFCYECGSSEPVKVDLADGGYYEAICPNGHVLKYILQQQQFEILFQMAMHAICDGYYREAVSSFASSLERFYEFYIKFISEKNGIPKKLIDEAWKPISKLSERQLGAFVFTYLNERRIAPALIADKWTTFRNEVIHKGSIPKREKVVEYGQAVLEVIEPILNELKVMYPEQIRLNVIMHKFEVSQQHGFTESGICWFTFVSLSTNGVPPKRTIVEGLEQLEINKRVKDNMASKNSLI